MNYLCFLDNSLIISAESEEEAGEIYLARLKAILNGEEEGIELLVITERQSRRGCPVCGSTCAVPGCQVCEAGQLCARCEPIPVWARCGHWYQYDNPAQEFGL